MNHILITSNEIVAAMNLASIVKSAFLHHSARSRVACEVICPYVLEMHCIDAVVEQKS